ncbi:MAG: hypothetical protein RL329_1152 [Bacteroidota bacterium]|jgi:hypothetical protein
MTQTYTNSVTNTYTESRAIYITNKAFEDILGIEIRGFITSERAQRWRSDILYLLNKNALTFFEIQFTLPNGTRNGLRYVLKADGSIYGDDESGGDDFWNLPNGTSANILVSWKSSIYNKIIQNELAKRGYQTGHALSAAATQEREYSKDGYGFQKNKIGTW